MPMYPPTIHIYLIYIGRMGRGNCYHISCQWYVLYNGTIFNCVVTITVDAHFYPYPPCFYGRWSLPLPNVTVILLCLQLVNLFSWSLYFFIVLLFVTWSTLFIERRQTTEVTATATTSKLSHWRHAAWKGRNKLRLDYEDRLCRMNTS